MIKKYIFLGFVTLLVFTNCGNEKVVEKKAAKIENETIKSTEKESEKVESVPVKQTIDLAQETKESPSKTVTSTVKTAPDKKKKPADKKKRAIIKFDETTYKFGRIKEGEKVKHDFNFKNVGDAALVIKKVDVSCGCTFPSYPFIPIEPGETGKIGVTFNSEHKLGRQKPTVTIITNASPRTYKLYLEGVVE